MTTSDASFRIRPARPEPPSEPLRLTAAQVDMIKLAACGLETEKRDVLIARTAAHLRHRSGRLTDDAVAVALRRALASLAVGPAA